MGNAASGNLVKVIKPKFVSLVGTPANQTPIKIVRSTSGETTMSKPGAVRRVMRSEPANAVLKLTFPTTMSDDEISSTLSTYGMKGFAVERTGDVVTATRSDLQSIAKPDAATLDIKLGGGISATVLRSEAVAATSGKSAVAVVGFEFIGEQYADAATVTEWLTRNSVDKASEPVQNPQSSFVVTRGDVQDGAETRRLEVEEGVVAIIARADSADVPATLLSAVVEAAYGNWGWGMLDFNQAMADEEFCDGMEDSLYTLQDVIWRIVFYSQLPLDQRKALIKTALSQFDDFVSTLVDSLPRQMMASVVRSAQHKEISMSNKDQTGGTATQTAAVTDTTRAAPAATATTAAPAATTVDAAADAAKPVTRGELKDLLRSTLTEMGLAAPATAAATEAAAAATTTTAPAAETATLTRADLKAAMADIVKPMQDEIAALKGTTVLRSDTGDTSTQAVETGAADRKNLFRGALGALPVGGRK